MKHYFLKFILGLIFIAFGQFLVSTELKPEITGAGIVLLADLLFIDLGYEVYSNWKRVRLVVTCKWLALKGEHIRFSMAYLYRIKVNDKYLLVKNSNFGHYQLVGGKYKRLPGTQIMLQNEFQARDDLKMSANGLMKDDFALFVPAKNAIKFLDWFNTGKDREISHWREFYEELIEGKANILSKDKWPYVNYNLAGRITTPVKKTPGWNCHEILQYDILDLLPNADQLRELELLERNGETNYIKWADEELVKCLGYCNRTRNKPYDIGIHTKWAVNMKWSRD